MNSSDQLADICPCCNRPYDLDAPPATKKASKNDFEVFWKAYPKKVGKGYCQEIWKKKKLPDIETILFALRKAIASHEWQRDYGKFIPNPSTWLNQGRWEDAGIDYDALSRRKIEPTITSRISVNEEEAAKWLTANYDCLNGVPKFSTWPQNLQQEYLNTIK